MSLLAIMRSDNNISPSVGGRLESISLFISLSSTSRIFWHYYFLPSYYKFDRPADRISPPIHKGCDGRHDLNYGF